MGCIRGLGLQRRRSDVNVVVCFLSVSVNVVKIHRMDRVKMGN